ncbi:MAG: phage terminase large subunit family protein, partial [bacterium]|nr:phage terminase large subunit family protein [bacterium]
GTRQKLVWGGIKQQRGIKFKRDQNGEIISIWYECRSCHEGIDESHKTKMLADGEWEPTHPHRKKRGYHLNSLYSPLGWVSWKQIADEFLRAKDSPERLKVWTNTRMAEVWDEEGSQPDWVILKSRSESYQVGTVPDPGVVLASGVDVQENRLVVVVRAWGPGEESWGTLFTEIYGNPNREGVWMKLDALLNRPFMHASGIPLYIDTMAVDSGYLAQAVYNFCRHRPLKTIAIKGVGVPGKPVFNRPSRVDVTWKGESIKEGCQLWTVGVDAGKAQLYSRLSMRKPGPGYYHFPIGFDDEYYIQLTAEKRVTEYKNGFPRMVWVKLRERNDVLDCEVYAYAAAL